MSCNGACLSISSVIIADYQSVNRERILTTGDLLCEGVYNSFNRKRVWMLDQLSFYGVETLTVEPVHALAPTRQLVVSIYQGKWNPLNMALAHLLHILKGEGTRS